MRYRKHRNNLIQAIKREGGLYLASTLGGCLRPNLLQVTDANVSSLEIHQHPVLDTEY